MPKPLQNIHNHYTSAYLSKRLSPLAKIAARAGAFFDKTRFFSCNSGIRRYIGAPMKTRIGFVGIVLWEATAIKSIVSRTTTL
jgi:hypothetical protein